MSISNNNIIDGIAISDDGKCLRLLIADAMNWENEEEHLMLLQEKINGYLMYCESRQYQELYPESEIEYGVFEIHFLYELTDTAIEFLNEVQGQICSAGVRIECRIAEAESVANR